MKLLDKNQWGNEIQPFSNKIRNLCQRCAIFSPSSTLLLKNIELFCVIYYNSLCWSWLYDNIFCWWDPKLRDKSSKIVCHYSYLHKQNISWCCKARCTKIHLSHRCAHSAQICLNYLVELLETGPNSHFWSIHLMTQKRI